MPSAKREIIRNDLQWFWPFWARDKQLPPEGDWGVWLIRAGRGNGKTRTGAETCRYWIDRCGVRTINVAGPTWGDVWTYMVFGDEGAVGLMGIWPEARKPVLTDRQNNPHLVCHNGAIIRLRSAQKAERFRGPQAEKAWVDEIATWKPEHMSAIAAFNLFEMGIRKGENPQIVATTTPKPRSLSGYLADRPDTIVTTGTTQENRANLSAKYIARQEALHGGTRLGRQEMGGEELEDAEDAIVSREMISEARVTFPCELERIAVGVDPYGGGGDACGIGVEARGIDGDSYVLADRTNRLGPDGWARTAVEAYVEFEADICVIETNYGGDMSENIIKRAAQDLGVRHMVIKGVPSLKSKSGRFGPMGQMYEQGKVHHVGVFDQLEAEVCSFTLIGYDGDASPNNADAIVFAHRELFPTVEGLSFSDLGYGVKEVEQEGKAA